MNKIIKIPILVACLLLVSSITAISLADEPSMSIEIEKLEAHGTISVTGTASVQTDPDQMSVSLRVVGQDIESVANARDEAAKILDKVLNALEKLNIPEENIETTSYTLEPVYKWEHSENVFKGYFATVIIKVTLNEEDFGKSGKIIDAAANAGSLVDNIQFELTNKKREELKLELFAQATKDAKLKAETMVTAIGDTLGNVKSLNANNYGYNPLIYFKGSFDYADNRTIYWGGAPPTTILPTDLTITVNVNANFEIM